MDGEGLKKCLGLLKQADSILLAEKKDAGHAALMAQLIESILSDYEISSDASFFGESPEDELCTDSGGET